MKRRVENGETANQSRIGEIPRIENHSEAMSTDEHSKLQPRKKRATSRNQSEKTISAHETSNSDLVRDTNALSVLDFQSRFLPQQSPLLSFTPKGGTTSDKIAHFTSIAFKASSDLSESELEGCFSLVKETSSEAYRQSVVRWRPKAKKEEMREKDMRYLIVRAPDLPSDRSSLDQPIIRIDGFLSFMITQDDDYEYAVLYVYEIHLSGTLRGCGMGAHLMHVAETIARRIGLTKVMLTVFTSNVAADKFYRKLGFSKDATSPEPRVLRNGLKKPMDYIIMSKDVRATLPPMTIGAPAT